MRLVSRVPEAHLTGQVAAKVTSDRVGVTVESRPDHLIQVHANHEIVSIGYVSLWSGSGPERSTYDSMRCPRSSLYFACGSFRSRRITETGHIFAPAFLFRHTKLPRRFLPNVYLARCSS
jgi:hypothetical protein